MEWATRNGLAFSAWEADDYSTLVHLATVPHSKNEHQKFAIANFVNDAIVAGTYSPFARASNELLRGRWAWIRCEEINYRLNPPTRCRV